MRKILLVIVAFLTVSSLSAKDNFKHNQLGASGSMFSGAGLSYKYIFNNIWAAKATAFIYYYSDDNDNYETELWTSLGGEVQYYLHHSKHSGLYLFIGLAEWYEENQYNYNSEQNDYNSTDFNRRFNIGPGFGLDLIIWENIVINFDVGFIYAIENNDYSDTSYENNNNPKSFTYGGGIGLSYRF